VELDEFEQMCRAQGEIGETSDIRKQGVKKLESLHAKVHAIIEKAKEAQSHE
jgi:hypothetical protein